jgi:hypothetical protein
MRHVMLLLSLLTNERPNETHSDSGPQYLGCRPSLVILWNIGSLLMEVNEANENAVQGGKSVVNSGMGEYRMRFRSG